MSRRARARLRLLALTLPLLPAPMQAAARPEFSYYGRDRSVSVADRPHPELDPLGLPIGTLLLRPSVTGGLYYDDNIYALPNGRVSDGVAILEASADLASDWNRNGIDIAGTVRRRQYVRAASQSTTDALGSASGTLDIPAGSLSARVGGSRLTQARTDVDAPNAALRPIRYGQIFGHLQGEHEFGRLRLLGGLDWKRFRFSDAETRDGIALDQHYRDRDVVTGDARVDFAIDPRISVYVDATVNSRFYRRVTAPLDRDSHGHTIEAGSDFDITRLVRGHVQFGYLSQTGMDDLWSARGFSGRGKVEWFTTPVLTITVEGGRTIEDSAETDTAAYASTTLQAHADYELLRSLILTASGGITWDRFESIDRRTRRLALSAGARYRLGRHIVVELTADHLRQRDRGTLDQRPFRDNRVAFSLRLQR